MPAWQAQQEDGTRECDEVSVTKSPVARRLASLACRASVHR